MEVEIGKCLGYDWWWQTTGLADVQNGLASIKGRGLSRAIDIARPKADYIIVAQMTKGSGRGFLRCGIQSCDGDWVAWRLYVCIRRA